MKKYLIFLIPFLVPFLVLAEGPIIQQPDTYSNTSVQQEFDNVYQDLRGKVAGSGTCIDNPTFCVNKTSHSVSILGLFQIGLSSPTSTTATAIAGGGTLAGTYYYKVFPFSSLGTVGLGSQEIVIAVSGGNNAVSLTWNTVQGASYYRIQRGTSQGSGDGYYQTTGTSYTDTGASFTAAGGAITAGSNISAIFTGVLELPASNGSLNFIDYTDNLVKGHIGITSAGEFEIGSGSGTQDGIYLLERADNTAFIKISANTNPYWQFNNSLGNLGRGVIEADPLIISQNGVHNAYINSSSFTILMPSAFKGETGGLQAAPGNIGEVISSSAVSGFTNYKPTTQFGDLVAVTLTAGDWLLSCYIEHAPSGATITSASFGMSTNSGNSSAGLTDGVNYSPLSVDSGISAGGDNGAIPFYHVAPTSNTTYYLKFQATYLAGQPQATGRITALRIH